MGDNSGLVKFRDTELGNVYGEIISWCVRRVFKDVVLALWMWR